jgi:hypothetical protein
MATAWIDGITPTYVALYGEDTEIEGEVTDAIFTAGDDGEGSHDGFILGNAGHTAGESTQSSLSGSDAIQVGDIYFGYRRLVGIVSIDTSSLPNDAEIVNATLTLPRGASYGAPFTDLTNSSDDVIRLDIKTGLTQFRLFFTDPKIGNTTPDRLGFYSAEASNSANRPKLTVYYQVPNQPEVLGWARAREGSADACAGSYA